MNQNEHNRNEQKKRILAYAFNEFVTKGLRAVKVDDLASSLGISKRTLYEMFQDKEGLLIECMKFNNESKQEEFEKLRKECKNSLETFAKLSHLRLKEIHAVNPSFLSEIKKYDKVKAYFEETSQKRNETIFLFIDECIKEGLFRDDINYNIILKMLEITCRAILDNELYKQYGFENIVKTIDATFIRGICTQKGLDIINSNNPF